MISLSSTGCVTLLKASGLDDILDSVDSMSDAQVNSFHDILMLSRLYRVHLSRRRMFGKIFIKDLAPVLTFIAICKKLSL